MPLSVSQTFEPVFPGHGLPRWRYAESSVGFLGFGVLPLQRAVQLARHGLVFAVEPHSSCWLISEDIHLL